MQHQTAHRSAVMLSASQVGERLGVHRVTVGRWIAAGLLPAVNIGSPARPRIRVSSADLDAFLDARRISRAS